MIGIVTDYIPYLDVAISIQTERPRIVFEENSGLATVAPMDAVLAAFAEFMPESSSEPAGGDELVSPTDLDGSS